MQDKFSFLINGSRDHPLPFSAEVKNEYNIRLLSWRVQGQLYFTCADGKC
jgi:hypothetical protein